MVGEATEATPSLSTVCGEPSTNSTDSLSGGGESDMMDVLSGAYDGYRAVDMGVTEGRKATLRRLEVCYTRG